MGNTVIHEIMAAFQSSDADTLAELMTMLTKVGVSETGRNNHGQTPLHFACGKLPPRYYAHRSKMSPLDFVLDSGVGASINSQDHDGIRPIHLAATISEELVAKLIRKGADATACTYEGKNLLHIAARARESNTIGLLLGHFAATGRLELVNSPDEKGQTALYDACRSGRPESVDLLLRAGADPNFRDKAHHTPVYACAEFEEENFLWCGLPPKSKSERDMDAAGFLSSDNTRPRSRNSSIRYRSGIAGFWPDVNSDDGTVRIRDTIHLLRAHGANIDVSNPVSSSPISYAAMKGCADVVDELLPLVTKKEVNPTDEEQLAFGMYLPKTISAELWLTRYLANKCDAQIHPEDIRAEGDNTDLCMKLLALRQYKTIERLPDMGVDFGPCPGYQRDFLSILSKGGYATLLECLGASSAIQKPGWVDGIQSPEHDSQKTLSPYLITAVGSQLPNLEVIKVLVESFGADVNIQPEASVYQRRGGYKYVPGQSALHILACGQHWWQTQAMEYLLDHGANAELRNQTGQTVLHVAVSDGRAYGYYRSRETTNLLLERGADPNTMDENGLTCLSAAMHDVELVRLLIKHGTDITLGRNPVLLSAIDTQDITTIAMLLEAGANCNMLVKKPNDAFNRSASHNQHQDVEYYPVHYAASSNFNADNRRGSAIQIIKLFLENGADPYLEFRQNKTILHDLLATGGVFLPFLEIPNLDLERRDSKGRTLLLAACKSRYGTNTPAMLPHPPNPYEHIQVDKVARTSGDPSPARTIYELGADLMVVDNDGNNALHLLIRVPPHNNEEYKKTFQLFIDKAPSLVHQKNAKGYTPFHYAAKEQRIWTMDTLLDAGADPREKDTDGNTPLHHISSKLWCTDGSPGLFPYFKKLSDLGVSINEKNNQGETALFNYFRHVAHPPDTLRTFFADLDPDLFVRNDDGETLLHLVATISSDSSRQFYRLLDEGPVQSTFEFLMELDLDPMIEDNNQRTALVSCFEI